MRDFFIACLALVLIAAAFGGGAFIASLPAATAPQSTVVLAPGALVAEAAILYDPTSQQVLYQKNAQEPLPLASLTKLMTLDTALASRDLGSPVRITQADLAPDGDWGLRPGDTLTLLELIRLALIASSNDAAAAVASSLKSPVSALNQNAQNLALTNTSLNNTTGLDESATEAGAYGSAFDVARLTAAFYKKYPAIFELTAQPSVTVQVSSRTLTFNATVKPLQSLPGFVAAKTGYTDLAGGNLAAIVDLSVGRPLIAVVLHSTEAGRFSDVRALIEAARTQLP